MRNVKIFDIDLRLAVQGLKTLFGDCIYTYRFVVSHPKSIIQLLLIYIVIW